MESRQVLEEETGRGRVETGSDWLDLDRASSETGSGREETGRGREETGRGREETGRNMLKERKGGVAYPS